MVSKVSKAYDSKQNGYSIVYRIIAIIVLMILFIWKINRYTNNAGRFIRGVSSFIAGSKTKTLKALTWNVAAINNNPFEYWYLFFYS